MDKQKEEQGIDGNSNLFANGDDSFQFQDSGQTSPDYSPNNIRQIDKSLALNNRQLGSFYINLTPSQQQINDTKKVRNYNDIHNRDDCLENQNTKLPTNQECEVKSLSDNIQEPTININFIKSFKNNFN